MRTAVAFSLSSKCICIDRVTYCAETFLYSVINQKGKTSYSNLLRILNYHFFVVGLRVRQRSSLFPCMQKKLIFFRYQMCRWQCSVEGKTGCSLITVPQENRNLAQVNMSCERAADGEGEEREGGTGPPTGRLLAAALVLVGCLGVLLNALVITGVRQAKSKKSTKQQKTHQAKT